MGKSAATIAPIASYCVAIAQFNLATDNPNKPGRAFYKGQVFSADVFGDEMDSLEAQGAIVRIGVPVADLSDAEIEE